MAARGLTEGEDQVLASQVGCRLDYDGMDPSLSFSFMLPTLYHCGVMS